MFGYVNIYKEELKIKDYLTFRSYYCGLCHALGKNCSQSSRLGLSYDMTFLAILLSSLSDKDMCIKEKPCIAHPLSKRKYVIDDISVDYAANASALLYYSKMIDDWHDDRSMKALAGIIIYRRSYKKASKKYPELAKSIKQHLDELSALEAQNARDIDLTADCFAKITQELFSPSFIGDNRRAAGWLGYNIGRWIYIIDAFNDLESDIKKNNYNPLHPAEDTEDFDTYYQNLALRLAETLTFTLENAVSGYNLLKVYKNKDILENILYPGLKTKQDSILGKITNNKTIKDV